MSFAFTHLVSVWLLGKLYEKVSKKTIGHYSWFFLLFGSILPDADFLLDWSLGTEFHRTFTHSLLFVGIVSLITYLFFYFLKRTEARHFSLFLAAGMISHFVLDMSFSYGVPLLWPHPLYFSWTKIQFFDPGTPSFLDAEASRLRLALIKAILDMAIGTAWIFYLLFKKRIEFS